MLIHCSYRQKRHSIRSRLSLGASLLLLAETDPLQSVLSLSAAQISALFLDRLRLEVNLS